MSVKTGGGGEAPEDAVKRIMAERVLRAMVFFQTEHKRRVSVPNTGERRTRKRNTVAGKKGSTYTVYNNPSKPGEYPRKITGAGQKGVVYGPQTIDGIIFNGIKGKMGQVEYSSYMVTLEMYRDRLGFIETAKDLKPQIAAILAKGSV